jgi:hypothetical protein
MVRLTCHDQRHGDLKSLSGVFLLQGIGSHSPTDF